MSTIALQRAQRETDTTFGLAIGLYVGLLATGPAVYATARLGLTDGAVLYGVALATVALVTAVGWLATWRRPALAVVLGGSGACWLPALLASGYTVGSLLLAPEIGLLALVAFLFGAVAAAVPAVALGFLTRTRYADTVLAGATEYESVAAGWSPQARNRLAIYVTPVIVLGGASMAVVFWFEPVQLGWSFGQLLVPAGFALLNKTQSRTYTLTDAGIKRAAPFGRKVYTWDRFEGYSRTETDLVLHRRWDLDMRFARSEIDDPDAVASTLDEFLPRR